MKILCDRQNLQDAFSVVSGIPPQKTPKPIIQNVLLRSTEDGEITFFATDFELSARSSLSAAKVQEAGDVLLPARETAALLRELSEPTLSLTAGDDHRCTLEAGSGSFVLVGADPADFPPPPEFESSMSLRLPAGDFMDMVRRTQFAAAREETRYAINGLLLDFEAGTLRLVGTDGRRLALCHAEIDGPEETIKAVVPIRSLQALGRAVADQDSEQLEIRLGSSQIGFSIGSVEIISQLLDNRFPNYEQVIPKAAETTIEVDRAMLERCLRRVAVLSSGDVRMVHFEFRDNQLRLSAESSGVGSADQTMDAVIEGDGNSISFNPDYLLDALKVSDREVVRIDMTDDATPAKFALAEAYTYVLMPISGS